MIMAILFILQRHLFAFKYDQSMHAASGAPYETVWETLAEKEAP